ncbi:helix-turn-helix domain-containing protein [Arthrobacter oryzae]|uniref:helix-turn-helix domain-containing protein n=1 Tax=Arthrobacter oryzae TaxID=409290 RepID=UPI002784355D|nr:helix-turn-helix domain-containing protein [Arthrobacter oryzae]MDQ0078480.1 transposase [Arthrobacter oryzae]
MNNSMSCSSDRWCMRADALLGVEGIHVSAVAETTKALVLRVETGEDITGCPECGVVAVGHGRRLVRLLWAKRLWRCLDPDSPRATFTEDHQLAGSRAKLTTRAVAWAADALARFDTSVSALAHELGVSWHTVWDAVRAEASQRTVPRTG